MTPEAADQIVSMVESNWPMYLNDPSARDLWLKFFEKHDAEAATRALAHLAEKQGEAPTIFEFREVIGMFAADSGQTAVGAGTCERCGGDKMVLAGYRKPQVSAWQVERGLAPEWHTDPSKYDPLRHGQEEWAPCPDCNPQTVGVAADYRERFDRVHGQ